MNQDAATGSNEEVELTPFPLFPVLLFPQFLPLTLLLVLLVLLLVLLLCVFFNLLSDNESNTIRVIWYFVMLYNCLAASL